MIDRDEVRAGLTGPISSLTTPFTRDGAVDHDGLRGLIDANLAGGSRTALLTWGDSLFSVLTDDEIAEVTATVADHARGRALTVAADSDWWTGKTVEFARYCREIGIDVLMVKPPVWSPPGRAEFVEHYRAVAAEIPVMLVTNVWAGMPDVELSVVAELLDQVEGVMALKDDMGGELARKVTAMAGERWAVFAGGQKQQHLDLVHYGAVGYMSSFVSFQPEVSRRYWNAVCAGDWAAAARVVEQDDWPLFDYLMPLPGGFDGGFHALLEVFGVVPRWRRPPHGQPGRRAARAARRLLPRARLEVTRSQAMETTRHEIHFTDSRRMSAVGDDTIDLVVTSPPYPMVEMWDEQFAAADPSVGAALSEQAGARTFELMHSALDEVWSECHRILRPGGLACINIGDATRKIGGEFRLFSNHSRVLQKVAGLGFSILPDILWRKPTNAPNKFLGSGMLPAGAYVTYEHEYVLILRKGGPRRFSPADKARRRRSAFFWEERNAWFSDVWVDLVGARQLLGNAEVDGLEARARSAAFPFELAYRLIQMHSLIGDTVLDPFLGTGTTTAAAIASGRASIGFEIEDNLERTDTQRHRDRRSAGPRVRAATTGCPSRLRAFSGRGGTTLQARQPPLRIRRGNQPGDRPAVRCTPRGEGGVGGNVLGPA